MNIVWPTTLSWFCLSDSVVYLHKALSNVYNRRLKFREYNNGEDDNDWQTYPKGMFILTGKQKQNVNQKKVTWMAKSKINVHKIWFIKI